MNWLITALVFHAVAPALLMFYQALRSDLFNAKNTNTDRLWYQLIVLSAAALYCAMTTLTILTTCFLLNLEVATDSLMPLLRITLPGVWIAALVQFLGLTIAIFSKRYLQGEQHQSRYIYGLSGVLAAVHVLLLSDHWLSLILAWSIVGIVLKHLLCFYPNRPHALLAAHKKWLADRAADLLLCVAAALAFIEIDSFSVSELLRYSASKPISTTLEIVAVCLVLAVVVRTALLPVHGWLIQVMEAPTPVSALMHAGVVNLGGFVLIRFSPLLDASAYARWLLVLFGLSSAILAGFVMLTRISVKVRLAWSTVAQMGFMILECGLGLYQFALLHLIGHSLYKAYRFLMASSTVRQTRLQMLYERGSSMTSSQLLAPFIALAVIATIMKIGSFEIWPWWWSSILALAWAHVFWLPKQSATQYKLLYYRLPAGVVIVGLLTLAAILCHKIPLGVTNVSNNEAGLLALTGMLALYLGIVLQQSGICTFANWRRWSYAGFYLDECYTSLALKCWPKNWTCRSADRLETASTSQVLQPQLEQTGNMEAWSVR